MNYRYARQTVILVLGALLGVFLMLAVVQAAPEFPVLKQVPRAGGNESNELLVRIDETSTKLQSTSAQLSALHTNAGGQVVQELRWPASKSFPNGLVIQVVKLPQAASLQAAQKVYAASPLVRYAVPNARVVAQATPNDPFFTYLWGMHNTGQFSGTVDADVDALEAWDIRKESKSAKVLIVDIDTGVDYTHPDLSANYWSNPNEIAGNSIDDDHNGYVDDVKGWDFANSDNNPMDDHGHGTHTSGTIAAVGNNNIGVTGINWQANLLGLKFMDSAGSGDIADAIAAFHYVSHIAEHKDEYGLEAVITSNSWGCTAPATAAQCGGQAMKDAIIAAADQGVLSVFAAGNDDGYDNDNGSSGYPGALNLNSIIAVAATDNQDKLADFSNFGDVTVHVAAPGVKIASTIPVSMNPSSPYAYMDGTSMAAPLVAGAAALVWARRPELALFPGAPGHVPGTKTVKDILIETSDYKADLEQKVVSKGRVNLQKALGYQGSSGSRVLFYEGHIPSESISRSGWLKDFADGLVAEGYQVEVSTATTLTASALSGYDVAIIAAPTVDFTQAELAVLQEFVGNGRMVASGDTNIVLNDQIHLLQNKLVGEKIMSWLSNAPDGNGLFLLGEWGGYAQLHGIQTAVNSVAGLYGITFENNEVFDTEHNDGQSYWPYLEAVHPVLAGITQMAMYGTSSLTLSGQAFPLALAYPSATDDQYMTVAGTPSASGQAATVQTRLHASSTRLVTLAGWDGGGPIDETIFYDSFEPGSPHYWQKDGFWHIQANPETLQVLAPTVNPRLVTLPDSGQLPAATHGTHVAWYGDIAPRVENQPTNTFLGEFDPDQWAKSGGTSFDYNQGFLTSPLIQLPALPPAGRLLLQFQSWWEVESVDVHAYDLMHVFVSTNNGSTWDQVHRVNPYTDVDGAHEISYTSGGFNQPGVWQQKTVDLSAYAGQAVRLRFRFATIDNLYNGFRGWLIDEVKVRLLSPFPGPVITEVLPNPAAASAEVHIIGANFMTDSEVYVDSVLTQSTTHSDGNIGFIVPSLAVGDYTLTVVNPDGQSAGTPFTIAAPAKISIAPSYYEVSIPAGKTQQLENLVIDNIGAADLIYHLVAVDAGTSNAMLKPRRGQAAASAVGWLTVSPNSATVQPGAEASHSVTVNTTGLAIGTYNASIVIDHNDPTTIDPLRIPVTLRVINTPPVANAGADQIVSVGANAQLDGSGSSDVEDDPLTYLWSIISKPEGSAAELSDATAMQPTITTDKWGYYRISLVVNDGFADSAIDEVVIAADTPPVAQAGPDRYGASNSPATLSGANSYDPDQGDSISLFQWKLLEKPADSNATLDISASLPTVVFTPDVLGSYKLQLVVTDTVGLKSQPDEVQLQAVQAYAAPNPATERATFYYDSDLAGGQLKIYNIAGRLVRSLDLTLTGSTEWDLTDNVGRQLASGIYLWLLIDSEQKPVLSVPGRLVIQR